mgnify:CR=1 FL=1
MSKYKDRGSILVVDDIQEMRETLAALLGMKGFNVKCAANAQQALSEIELKRPALVLLDERMPGEDGLATLKKIKEMDSSIKVVMLSAMEDADLREATRKSGACDYINKLCDFEKLEAMILSILSWEVKK